ncbi:hypothetical protein Kisp01_07070 [Kineosporia sp. NBRC 101677]|nr:hypothetical protein Kisp01_07070 [Kineosporia sp. NBRC 101677]
MKRLRSGGATLNTGRAISVRHHDPSGQAGWVADGSAELGHGPGVPGKYLIKADAGLNAGGRGGAAQLDLGPLEGRLKRESSSSPVREFPLQPVQVGTADARSPVT